MDKTCRHIVSEFEIFGSWEEKYHYLIELGSDLPVTNSQIRLKENLIKGCQSKVWLICKNDKKKLYFYGDSDALITRGIVSLIIRIYSNRSPAEILENRLDDTLNIIGLTRHLSMTRSNGLQLMIQKIKRYAQSYK